ncbi:MAG TPA: hypothetical protein VMT39_00500 [Candidatus Bathyarchaeia archaeon]|jgi:hypothetical protein|nr:hypothetical protein [Candidatus Bathyarchaeia archaeon]
MTGVAVTVDNGEGVPDQNLGVEHRKPDGVKRLLALPRVPDVIKSNQEHTVPNVGIGLGR